ncbi:hypothetical protein Pcinc_034564 [Petrolisthes cinctipes]|uniref:LisH domain-containing protein n=1 Tax=Petrolisthes cinctipes TaxID=88211 RepID=A0AAE1BZR6_PETCI|nr:hypothetical protein Pcinc_034564 [Petrolisthes cinctipes]
MSRVAWAPTTQPDLPSVQPQQQWRVKEAACCYGEEARYITYTLFYTILTVIITSKALPDTTRMPASNRDVVQELQEILRQWEEDQTVSTRDPTPHIVKLCELFERETTNFLKKDPDPFDDRHPVTSEPQCAVGLILRALFKKDAFVTRLVNHYLRDNYFSSLGLTRDSVELNTAACRLLLDLLYGLDIPQVFNESETTVMRLLSWAEKGPEPLRTYATGLLAAAMDIPEIAASFRHDNNRLVPVMLTRLWQLKEEGDREREQQQQDNNNEGVSSTRPFAHLNSQSLSNGIDEGSPASPLSHSPMHSPIHPHSSSTLTHSPKHSSRSHTQSQKPPHNHSHTHPHSPPSAPSPSSSSLSLTHSHSHNHLPVLSSPPHTHTDTQRSSPHMEIVDRSPSPLPTPDVIAHAHSPPHNIAHAHSPSHNIAHAHSPPHNIAHAHSPSHNIAHAHSPSHNITHMHSPPPHKSSHSPSLFTTNAHTMTPHKHHPSPPIGEYQESLGHVYEHNTMDLIFHYLDVRRTAHARLSFEALRFLGSLLFHKKFCIEFVNVGGIQKLLQVPRPSLPADGVSLCLWYLGYCEEAVERICQLPDSVLTQLVSYGLWLLERSHQSSRTHAVMFFGLAFRFRAILERFDQQDGIRKILNLLSTLSLLQDNWEADDHPGEAVVWQMVKQVCLSLKQYFEAHLAIKVQQMQRLATLTSRDVPQLSTPGYKALSVAVEATQAGVEYLLDHLTLRSRWKAVERFLSLRGLQLLLQLIAVVLNETFSPKTETAVFALDCLYVCSVLPAVQGALCEKLTIPASDDILHTFDPQEVPGYAILVACIHESQFTMTAPPEVQKPALGVLINCLCAPLHRYQSSGCRLNPPGSVGVGVLTPGKKGGRTNLTSTEDVLNRAWDCVRTSNGIMYLLNVLHKKAPITDADCIRGLACRALVGLSRSDAARQIMSKLPIFTSGQLQLLMREPVLQDKRAEHVKFQRLGLELIQAVSGHSKAEGGTSADVSIQSIHRADVVSQTRIRYNKTQLLHLIQTHLIQEGYEEVAAALRQAASLPQPPPPLPPAAAAAAVTAMGPPRSLTTPPPAARTHRILSGGSSRHLYAKTAASPAATAAATTPHSPSPPPLTPTTPTTPLHIKISRSAKRGGRNDTAATTTNNSPSTPGITSSCGGGSTIPPAALTPIAATSTPPPPPPPPSLAAVAAGGVVSAVGGFSMTAAGGGVSAVGGFSMTAAGGGVSTGVFPMVAADPTISLDRIVTEYLMNQHALCKNPVVTCPTFDLFQPHSCPEPRSVRVSATHFTVRHSRQQYLLPAHSRHYSAAASHRHFVYSRYRPTQTYRPTEDDDIFLCCQFTPDDQFILVGTTRGEVRLFNKTGNEEGVYTVHQGAVSSLVMHTNGSLLLTSCTAVHDTSLWTFTDLLDEKFTLRDCQHADFSSSQDKIIGTSEQTARLYDLSTSQIVSEFTPRLSNHYRINKAVLDPSDDLLLTDGVLFDVRTGKQIHKFDKINPILNGVFHHNGLEVISSSEIWDLRTFHLLRTVPVLNLCDVVFNRTSDVIFGITVGDLLDQTQQNGFETSFKTVDASDYSSIATVDVRRVVSSLAVNTSDTQVAVVETESGNDELMEDSVVRVYEIGMSRQADEEMHDDEDEEEEDDMGNDEDSDSDDDDNDQNDDEISQDVEGGDEEEEEEFLGEDDDQSFTSSVTSAGEDDAETGSEPDDDLLFELSEPVSAWLQQQEEEEEDDDEEEEEEEAEAEMEED